MMASLEENHVQSAGGGVLAKPLTVEGVDDNDLEGHVSRDILQLGTKIVIPYWPAPEPKDELWIIWVQNGQETNLYEKLYPVPLSDVFLYFDLTPQHLKNDGVAHLYYKIWKASGGIDDPSPKRQLTIDHTPLIILDEPSFPQANDWGYLNNRSDPPMTSGATIRVPSLTNIALPGDQAKVQWQGYSSLNGSGPPVPGTFGVWERTLQVQDIANGFDLVVPFESYISRLFNNDSAVVVYQIFQGGRLVAESSEGVVKIDRATSGGSGPSNINATGDTEMAMKLLPPKPRPISTHSGIASIDIAVDTLADESIPIVVLESGKLIVKLTRPLDEDNLDNVDLYYAKAGGDIGDPKYTVELGDIADRPSGTIPIEFPADDFTEDAQPPEPTRWQVKLIMYKGSGGVDDPSNVVEFNIDRTAPFEVKFPTRRKGPPAPTPTLTNGPSDALRTINEAWLAANANLEFTVNVAYPLRRLDDVLEVHLTAGGVDLEVFNAAVGATGAFTVASSELRGLPNGRVNIHYFWTDLPGNRSASSTSAAVLTLALALDPVLNKRPLVPVTDPDGATAIYLDDFAGSGVLGIVERLPIDNAEPGDQIKFYIDEPGNQPNYIVFGPQPLADVDLNFPIPYDNGLADIFGASTDPMEVRAYVELERGTPITAFASPILNFWLDLYPPGGLYPELPDLTNPAFQLPVVTGQSQTPNVLEPGDRDKAGKFKVVLALTDPPIAPSETVKCYVNNQLVGDFSPFNNADEFEVPILATVIAALPTPSVLAHWTRQKTGIDKNVIRSPSQTVTVQGRRIDLQPPIIRVRNPAVRDFIECFAMLQPVTTATWTLSMTIPKDPTNLPTGTIITVHFAAYTDAAGTNLITGTDVSNSHTILDAATPDVATVADAAVFKLAQPFRNTVAYGKYWYTANISGTQSSIPIIKQMDNISNSFEYCDRTAAVAAP
jgi:hypothetical protein